MKDSGRAWRVWVYKGVNPGGGNGNPGQRLAFGVNAMSIRHSCCVLSILVLAVPAAASAQVAESSRTVDF